MTDTPMPDSTTPRPAGPDLTTPLAEVEWLLPRLPVGGEAEPASITLYRKLPAVYSGWPVRRVRLAPSSPGAPVGDAPVTDPRDMDAASPPAGTGGERESCDHQWTASAVHPFIASCAKCGRVDGHLLPGGTLDAAPASRSGGEDAERLSWLEAQGVERQAWLNCDHLPKNSVAFAEEGPLRWTFTGQGLANNTKGATARAAIDAARAGGSDAQ